MWTLLRLALRNVTRHRSRTAITLGALCFGVFMSLLLGSFVTGLQRAMLDDLVKGRLGAVQVHKKGYFDARNNQPLKLDFEASPELERRILATPGVVGAAPRIVFSGLVGNGSAATMVVAQAIDAGREQTVAPWEQRSVAGEPITAKTPHGVVLGGALAKALHAQPGASLTLQASTREGKENAVDLDLLGSVDGANPLESKRLALVPLAYAQEMLGMPGRITEYAIAVRDIDDVAEVAAALQGVVGPEFEVNSWRDLRPNIADLFAVQSTLLASISFVFLLIAVIGIANTLLMSVIERTREIGTMMAVGVRRAKIGLLFVMEAAAQAVLGGSLGAAAAIVVTRVITARGGIPMKPPEVTEAFMVSPSVPTSFMVLALVLSTTGAILAALYPAIRAAKLRPVEALREA